MGTSSRHSSSGRRPARSLFFWAEGLTEGPCSRRLNEGHANVSALSETQVLINALTGDVDSPRRRGQQGLWTRNPDCLGQAAVLIHFCTRTVGLEELVCTYTAGRDHHVWMKVKDGEDDNESE